MSGGSPAFPSPEEMHAEHCRKLDEEWEAFRASTIGQQFFSDLDKLFSGDEEIS